MNIKNYLTAIICLLFSTISFAQEYKDNITSDFTKYLNSIENMDFKQSVEYMVPEFFRFVPKADLLKLMEETYNNPEVEFEIRNTRIQNIEKPQLIDDKYYALLTYSNIMDMKFISEDELVAKEKETETNLALYILQYTYGEDYVIYNEQKDHFEIYIQKDVYAVSENGLTDWKFIVLEKDHIIILEQILPKVLLEHLIEE